MIHLLLVRLQTINDTNMEINYYVKSVYGNEMAYIADTKKLQAISILTGQKTLSARHMEALEELGFSFKEVIAPRA